MTDLKDVGSCWVKRTFLHTPTPDVTTQTERRRESADASRANAKEVTNPISSGQHIRLQITHVHTVCTRSLDSTD